MLDPVTRAVLRRAFLREGSSPRSGGPFYRLFRAAAQRDCGGQSRRFDRDSYEVYMEACAHLRWDMGLGHDGAAPDLFISNPHRFYYTGA